MSIREPEDKMTVDPEEEMGDETFLKDLYLFMTKRDSPIEKIPHLGFKQIDLLLMYKTVAKMGGYHKVTSQQLWKQVYNTLGGNPRSTSAATCTRRHYEKLLLPYECHLKGKDYMEVLPSRPNKRFFYNSQSADEECPRAKMMTNHTPLLQQTYPMDSPVRGMPGSYRQYYPKSHLTLPFYVPLLPPNGSHSVPQTAPQAPLPYSPPPPPPGPTERVPQPLEHLRYLAEMYNRHISQPLDLRRKDSSPDPCNNPASSFTQTSSMKPPKFLNRVSPLYQANVLAREEGCERPKAGKSSPVYFTYPPISGDGCVIDLTSSRSSRSPPHAPTTPAQSGSPIPQLRDDPSTVHPLKPLKTQVRPELRTQAKEENDQTSSGPLNLSRSHPGPPRESGGRMEIQIPLALLQNWIKEGLQCGPTASGVGNLSLQTSTGPTSSHTPGPKHGEWAVARPDIPSSRSNPTNPPFHHPYVAQQMWSLREKSLDRDRNMQSHTATNGDLPLTPAYSPHRDYRDVYRWEEPEARRPYHGKTTQHQTPRDRNPREEQSKSHSSPQPLEQDEQGPRSSYSLSLTPEEFVKLKRLISSS